MSQHAHTKCLIRQFLKWFGILGGALGAIVLLCVLIGEYPWVGVVFVIGFIALMAAAIASNECEVNDDQEATHR